ncbi:MAG: DUF1573 domain-containing protein [Verrucomicrobiales bacterium]
MSSWSIFLFSAAVALAQPAWAGLVFERDVASETSSPSADTHESQFVFKNAGSRPVTISEIQTTCGCLGASADKKTYQPGDSGVVTATIKLGSFEGEVIKSIYVISDDPKAFKRMLQMKITIPRLMEISPEVTTWTVGEAPTAKKLTIKVLREEPIEVTAVSSTRQNMSVELRELEKGRSYEVILTPKTTAEPTLGAVKIETTCELNRYKNRLVFYNIVRQRRPAGAAIPAPGAATPPSPAPAVPAR